MPGVRVFQSLDEVPREFGPCVVTIGNFDGVHVGHREIMRRVAGLAAREGWQPAAVTFDPHPANIVAPERAPNLLSTPRQRCHWMGDEGIGHVLVIPFTPEFSYQSPDEFAEGVLRDRLRAKAVMVGENFRFGRQQGGDASKLRELGGRLGFQTEIMSGIRCRGRLVSSSEIRRLIGAGNVTLANRFLGRPYGIEGEVVSGRGIGSRRTVPTLNLEPTSGVLPATGVYVTRTRDANGPGQWPSVTNVGYRPTFGGEGLTVETHLLESLDDEPPRRIYVEFLRRLRGEQKFADAAALKAQILNDAGRGRTFFRRWRSWVGKRPAGQRAASDS